MYIYIYIYIYIYYFLHVCGHLSAINYLLFYYLLVLLNLKFTAT